MARVEINGYLDKPKSSDILAGLQPGQELRPGVEKILSTNFKSTFGGEHYSRLADSLASKKEILELLPIDHLDEETGFNINKINRIGTFLEKGTINVFGDVGEVSSIRGGTVIVDGDVDNIQQNSNGIIYVRGDVGTLQESDMAIIVIAGKLHRYVQREHSVGGLGLQIPYSPFVYTSSEVEVEVPDKRAMWDTNKLKDIHINNKPPYVNVVDQAELADWKVEDVRKNGMVLAKATLKEYLANLSKSVTKLKTPKQLEEFAEDIVFGKMTGYTQGYYKHSASNSRYDD